MTNVLGFPILSYLIFVPIAGAVLIMLFFPRERTGTIKNFALFVSLISLGLSLLLLPFFEPENVQMQFVQKHSWIPTIGVEYFVGIDGISILLILLTTLLTSISILCSYAAIEERQKEFYVSLLILETGMLGVFVAVDLFLFYIFWEVMLVPMYFLIGIWGGPRKLYAAIKFFLYTLFGSVLLLLGFLALYFLNGNPAYGSGELTFSLLELYKMAPKLPETYQLWIFLALFVGFAIKVPMFPFHTWLPDAHVEAPTAGSVILAGVLLKMGTYGFVRFSLPLLPKASETLIPFMAFLAIIGIIYGALVAMAQQDVKKLVAYSSVSHLGFVMLGIFALNSQGLLGALLQNLNHGLSTGALFLIVGIIYERRHTRMIADFGGLSKVIPVFTVIFAITMFSSIGLPGLNGFVGEFLILVGAFQVSKVYAAFAVAGIVLGAAYMLWLFQRMMFGTVDKSENQGLRDCNVREVVYMLPLILLMFWIGIYPKPYLKLMEPSVKNLVNQIELAKAGKPIDGRKVALPANPPKTAQEVRALVTRFSDQAPGKTSGR
ncbi:MAG: NADH-quinone oxidoreductase subunit M [Nitrospinota bacterium]